MIRVSLAAIGLVSGFLFSIWFVCLMLYPEVGGPLPWEAFWPSWIFYGTVFLPLATTKPFRTYYLALGCGGLLSGITLAVIIPLGISLPHWIFFTPFLAALLLPKRVRKFIRRGFGSELSA
jgi:hypothetical protein